MSVPTWFGIDASQKGLAFVVARATDGTTTVSFSGASAGQIALVFTSNDPAGTPPTGWSLLGSAPFNAGGNHVRVYSKVLSAGDIAAGSVAFTGANANVIVSAFYAGPTVATVVSTAAQDTASSLTLTGFTKAVSSKEVVTFVGGFLSGPITQPGLTIPRASLIGTTGGAVADVASANYPNGTALVWTYGANNSGGGFIVELT